MLILLEHALIDDVVVRQEAANPGAIAFAVIDDCDALVSVAQVETPKSGAAANLKLTGLDPMALYDVRMINPPKRARAAMKRIPALAKGETLQASGQWIAQSGLPMPILRAGEIAVLHLTRSSG